MVDRFAEILNSGFVFCLSLTPASAHPELMQALVCGAPLTDGGQRQLFLDTGLIHLLVVSGAHLAFLDTFLRRVPTAVRLGLLTIYCWLTGFGAPIVLALARRLMKVSAQRWRATPLQLELFSVTLLLAVHPPWLFSRSFLMSWMCALALSLPLPWPPQVHLNQSLRVFFCLWCFSPSSPLAILWNAILAPLVGDLLFPLCLAAFAFPWLAPVSDQAWDLFLKILELGPQASPAAWFLPTRSLFWIPFVTHLLLLMGEIRWRRHLAFS